MSKVVRLERWQPEGGWRWEVVRDFEDGVSGVATRLYRTDRDFDGLWTREPEQGSWDRVIGTAQKTWPQTRPEMLATLAADGHDISAVSVPFAFGEKDTGRGDV